MTETPQPPASPQQSDISDLAAAVDSQRPGAPGRPRYLKAHRGGAVLALGIIGLAVCFICGIIAWVMGNNDLREMAAGTMDRSGEGLTKAGKICGMISVLLAIVGFGIWLLMVLGMSCVAVSSR